MLRMRSALKIILFEEKPVLKNLTLLLPSEIHLLKIKKRNQHKFEERLYLMHSLVIIIMIHSQRLLPNPVHQLVSTKEQT